MPRLVFAAPDLGFTVVLLTWDEPVRLEFATVGARDLPTLGMGPSLDVARTCSSKAFGFDGGR